MENHDKPDKNLEQKSQEITDEMIKKYRALTKYPELELLITGIGVLLSSILIMSGLQDLWHAYKGKIDYDKGLIELCSGFVAGAIVGYIIYRDIKRWKEAGKYRDQEKEGR
ncbi:hypothetical protein HYV49_00975 [Candidatus Pacearchaeota archaeon]|nr:hypothetical protein [Candidatus Pacearchaeota archaeon]